MKQTLRWSIIALITICVIARYFNTWKLEWQIGRLDDKIEDAKDAGLFCLASASIKYYFTSGAPYSLYTDEDGRYIGFSIFSYTNEYDDPTRTEIYYDRKTDSIVDIVDSLFKERKKLMYILNTLEREKRKQRVEKLKNKYNIK